MSTSGLLSGTPTVVGSFPINVYVEDERATSVTREFTLVINQTILSILLELGRLPDGQTGVSYTQQFTASNGVGPYTYGFTGGGSTPPGLVLNPNTGALTGIPTQAGDYNFYVGATDSNGIEGTNGKYDITILPSVSLTQTTISSSLNPSTETTNVTFTANVTAPVILRNEAAPTPAINSGTIEFFDGTVSLGTAPVSAGAAQISTSALTVGLHNITAVYSGSASHTESTSTVLEQVVTAIPLSATQTTLISSYNPSFIGDEVTLTALVNRAVFDQANSQSAFAPISTGTVTFLEGTATLGSAPVSNGAAAFAISNLAAGAHNITAVYSGAEGFSESTSSVLVQNVNPIPLVPTQTTVSSSINPSIFGDEITLSAQVSFEFASGGNYSKTIASNSGTVTFFDGTTSIGSVPVSGGNALATLAVSSLSVGSHNITAVYSGDGTFAGSTSSVLVQTVGLPAQATTQTTISSSLNPSMLRDAVTLTATVERSIVDANTIAKATATIGSGTITFFDGAISLGSAPVSGGTAALTVFSLAVGSHDLTAVYSGAEGFFESTSAVLVQAVEAEPLTETQIALSSSLNPSTVGDKVTFTATISENNEDTGSSLDTATIPSVSFFNGTTLLGTVRANGRNTASLDVSTLQAGTHDITAQFLGTESQSPSTSAVLQQTVNAVVTASPALDKLQEDTMRLIAETSLSAVIDSTESAIEEGFSDEGPTFSADDQSMRASYAAENPNAKAQKLSKKMFDARHISASDRRTLPGLFAYDEDTTAIANIPSKWRIWTDVKFTGWSTNASIGNYKGKQFNGNAGISYKINPSLLVGAVAGYEQYKYTSGTASQNIADGNGFTLGAYLGWKITPALRFDATLAASKLKTDLTAGLATGSFDARRIMFSTGLTGSITRGSFLIQPSARFSSTWETESAYLDSNGITHAERAFSIGKVSLGAKVNYNMPTAGDMKITPYVGAYGDYRFLHSISGPIMPELDVLSLRLIGGANIAISKSANLSFDLEAIGLGVSEVNSVSGKVRFGIQF